MYIFVFCEYSKSMASPSRERRAWKVLFVPKLCRMPGGVKRGAAC